MSGKFLVCVGVACALLVLAVTCLHLSHINAMLLGFGLGFMASQVARLWEGTRATGVEP